MKAKKEERERPKAEPFLRRKQLLLMPTRRIYHSSVYLKIWILYFSLRAVLDRPTVVSTSECFSPKKPQQNVFIL
jgi:hypothetical protein